MTNKLQELRTWLRVSDSMLAAILGMSVKSMIENQDTDPRIHNLHYFLGEWIRQGVDQNHLYSLLDEPLFRNHDPEESPSILVSVLQGVNPNAVQAVVDQFKVDVYKMKLIDFNKTYKKKHGRNNV